MKRKPFKDTGSAQRLFLIPGLIEDFKERGVESLPGRYVMSIDANGNLRGQRRTNVDGIPIPPDLSLVCWRHARDKAESMEKVFRHDARTWSPHEDLSLPIKDEHVGYFAFAICDALEAGFRLALLRYAEDLKHVPEAAAMLEQRQKAAEKGGEGRRRKAEKKHKAIRKRFRELRKTVAKKTARYVRVAGEFGMSDRHIARIVDGID